MTLGEQAGRSFAQSVVTPLSNQNVAIEFYIGLSAPGRAGLVGFMALTVGAVVLGLLPEYSKRSVTTANRSPILSVLIGAPGTLVLGGMGYLGTVLAHSDLGVFFAIPFVTAGVVLLPVWTIIGVVATGHEIVGRFGRDGLASGLVVGSFVLGGVAINEISFAVITGLVTCFGVGAGVRVLISGSTPTNPSERSIPPANEI